MSLTSIQWTDRTWNPVRGCSRVSEGCRNCYAERIATRFSGPGEAFEGFADGTPRHPQTGRLQTGRRGHWTGKVALVPEKLDEPLRWRKPARVFVNSMSDLFHEGLRDEQIAAVFGAMAAATKHTYQVLTKRPARMVEWFRWIEQSHEGRGIGGTRLAPLYSDLKVEDWRGLPWPLPNVWLGVSVEDQKTADERIPLLLQTPAVKRFVSYEPALGPVNFGWWVCEDYSRGRLTAGVYLDQIIVGGESGPGARPFDLVWAKDTRDVCADARVAFFMKQWGAKPFDSSARCNAHIAQRKDSKGGDPSEWPEDLRVREFPG